MTAFRRICIAYGACIGLALVTGHWTLAGWMVGVPGLVFVGAAAMAFFMLTRKGQPL